MQPIAECYRKVSKDCFKFIRSQETSKEKFVESLEVLQLLFIYYLLVRSNKKPPRYVS